MDVKDEMICFLYAVSTSLLLWILRLEVSPTLQCCHSQKVLSWFWHFSLSNCGITFMMSITILYKFNCWDYYSSYQLKSLQHVWFFRKKYFFALFYHNNSCIYHWTNSIVMSTSICLGTTLKGTKCKWSTNIYKGYCLYHFPCKLIEIVLLLQAIRILILKKNN